MYVIGSKNHCDLYKGHIQPQTYWFSPDPYPLESNPPLTTLLTSLESRLGFPTFRKQNPNKNIYSQPTNPPNYLGKQTQLDFVSALVNDDENFENHLKGVPEKVIQDWSVLVRDLGSKLVT